MAAHVDQDDSDEDEGSDISSGSSGGEDRRSKVPTMQLSPFHIRFSQKKMRNVFGDNRLIEDSAQAVAAVRRSAEDAEIYDAAVKLEAPFPPIEVLRWRCKLRDETTGRPIKDERGRDMFEREESWFTLDNRRLYCLQKAALRALPEHCTADVIAEVRKDRRMREIRKFRTMDNGQSIMVGSIPDGVPFERWDWREETKKPNRGGRPEVERLPVQHLKGKGGSEGGLGGGKVGGRGRKGGRGGNKGDQAKGFADGSDAAPSKGGSRCGGGGKGTDGFQQSYHKGGPEAVCRGGGGKNAFEQFAAAICGKAAGKGGWEYGLKGGCVGQSPHYHGGWPPPPPGPSGGYGGMLPHQSWAYEKGVGPHYQANGVGDAGKAEGKGGKHRGGKGGKGGKGGQQHQHQAGGGGCHGGGGNAGGPGHGAGKGGGRRRNPAPADH